MSSTRWTRRVAKLAGFAAIGIATALPIPAFAGEGQALLQIKKRITLIDNPQGAAITRDGQKIYTSHGGYTTSVYNIHSGKADVLDGFGNSISANSVATSPTRDEAYVVSMADRYTWQGTVTVINTATDEVVGSVAVEKGAGGVAVSPDGNRVYVASLYSELLSVVDPRALRVIKKIRVGRGGQTVVVSPDGKEIYVGLVADSFRDEVVIIEAENSTVADRIPIEAHPYGMALSPGGDKLYVATEDRGVLEIDTKQRKIVAEIKIVSFTGSGAHAVAVSPRGDMLFVTHEPFFLSAVDTRTRTVVESLKIGGNPFGIVVAPGAGRTLTLYVATSGQPPAIVPTTPGDVLVEIAVNY